MRWTLALLLWAPAAAGQTADWSTLTVGAGAGLPLVEAFGAEWEAGVGAVGRVVSPAYGGVTRAAIDARAHAAQRDDLPGFRALSATLGWGPRLAGPGGASLAAGPHVGAVLLRFDRVDGGGFQNVTELEAAVGVWLRLDVPVSGRVSAWTEAQATRIAFAEPAAGAAVVGGLAVRFDTPAWAQTVLR